MVKIGVFFRNVVLRNWIILDKLLKILKYLAACRVDRTRQQCILFFYLSLCRVLAEDVKL